MSGCSDDVLQADLVPVFFKPVDHSVHDVIWVCAFAFVFALALDLDDLWMFSPASGIVDLDAAPEIQRGVFDGKRQLWMRLNLVGDFEIMIQPRVELVGKNIPGSENNCLPSLTDNSSRRKPQNFT